MVRRIVDNGSRVSALLAPASSRAASPRVDQVQVLPIAPGTFNLGVYRGDTYEWVFILTGVQMVDGVWTSTRLPFDITYWRFKAEIRSAVDGTLMASLQRVLPEYREDALVEMRAGTLRMRLTADQSRLMTGAGVWDLEVRTSDGWVKTVLRGAVNYLGDVTTGIAPLIGGA